MCSVPACMLVHYIVYTLHYATLKYSFMMFCCVFGPLLTLTYWSACSPLQCVSILIDTSIRPLKCTLLLLCHHFSVSAEEVHGHCIDTHKTYERQYYSMIAVQLCESCGHFCYCRKHLVVLQILLYHYRHK
jgi:hypothetical protein